MHGDKAANEQTRSIGTRNVIGCWFQFCRIRSKESIVYDILRYVYMLQMIWQKVYEYANESNTKNYGIISCNSWDRNKYVYMNRQRWRRLYSSAVLLSLMRYIVTEKKKKREQNKILPRQAKQEQVKSTQCEFTFQLEFSKKRDEKNAHVTCVFCVCIFLDVI